ncbi:CsbD family protein [Polynucleobacter arcticus]|uniref:CsbD family protein n=1 Tax=Polynucleobacter arcticus TaxID=1743165 RepID=A0A6M9PV56_9BURK|nr:CsbD family protein [Polynucleobacter arcticus]QKM59873.1 CsbD family protein [Polynucleobacter arcticus]
MNKDQVKGRIEEVKGAVKEVAGNIVGNKSLETEGIVQKNIGKVQAGLGDIKSDVKSKL